LMTIEESKFSDNVRPLRNKPKVIVKATNVATTAGIEESSELDGVRIVGQTEIPCDVGQTHVDIEWHRRGVVWTRLSMKAADTNRKETGIGLWGGLRRRRRRRRRRRWCGSRRSGLGSRGLGKRVRRRGQINGRGRWDGRVRDLGREHGVS
jgi:hypothetical protein